MPFPISPMHGEGEKQFLIQDPFGLRQIISPIIEMDIATTLVNGLGSSFRISPSNVFLTAQHVLEHLLVGSSLRISNKKMIMGVLSPGLVYGSPPMPLDCMVKVVDVCAPRLPLSNPLAELQGRTESTIAIDCMQLLFDPQNTRLPKFKNFLPICREMSLHIGQRVMAIGFPQIDFLRDVPHQDIHLYIERMYGAVGIVTELFPYGRGPSRPWPTFEVNADWRSGMSGGPVFNECGEVIGLVSTSLAPGGNQEGRGYGVWFGVPDTAP
jgi:serine protease Do